MNPPIINRPDLQSFQQKYGQSLITVLFWILFFFFMRRAAEANRAFSRSEIRKLEVEEPMTK